jgi:hypothetical protein
MRHSKSNTDLLPDFSSSDLPGTIFRGTQIQKTVFKGPLKMRGLYSIACSWEMLEVEVNLGCWLLL